MKNVFWDDPDPRVVWDDPNFRWGKPSFLLEEGDEGWVPWPPAPISPKPPKKKRSEKSVGPRRHRLQFRRRRGPHHGLVSPGRLPPDHSLFRHLRGPAGR